VDGSTRLKRLSGSIMDRSRRDNLPPWNSMTSALLRLFSRDRKSGARHPRHQRVAHLAFVAAPYADLFAHHYCCLEEWPLALLPHEPMEGGRFESVVGGRWVLVIEQALRVTM
jgi:hypothetical protein